jgi:peptidyl-prolyl cis-trans isomerase C
MAACGEWGVGASSSEALARVDGTVITAADLEAEIQRLPQMVRSRYEAPQERRRLLDHMIDTELLLREVRRRELDRDPELRGRIEAARRRILGDALLRAVQAEAVDEAAIRAYYEAHLDEFTQERLHVRHIVVPEKALAHRLREELAGGADFAALARQRSVARTAALGGDLGLVSRGHLDPAFEDAAFALTDPGEISEVVETDVGYQILQLVEPREADTRPLARVERIIRKKLGDEARSRFLEGLRENARIETTLREGAPAAAPTHPERP